MMSVVLAGIRQLTEVYSPVFQALAFQVFGVIVICRIALFGVQMQDGNIHVSQAGRELLWELGIGMMLIVGYRVPIGGFELGFAPFIMYACDYLANRLDIEALQQSNEHLNAVYYSFVQPGWMSLTASFMYVVLYLVIICAQVVSTMAIGGSYIGAAVLVVIGPLFCVLFIVPPLRFLFQNWFKMLVTFAFTPVVAFAFMVVLEFVIWNFQMTLPTYIEEDNYPLYIYTAMIYIGVFIWEMLHVRRFTAGLFAGYPGGGSVTSMISTLARIGG